MDIASSSLASKPSNKNGKTSWPEAPSMKQEFSFPDSIIYYVIKNPSTPEVYLKMAKSCKYFFEKNSVIVAACIRNIHDGNLKICSKNGMCRLFMKNHGCCVEINDITKITCKIWLTNKLDLSSFGGSDIPFLLASKIYRSEKAELKIGRICIFLKDFQLLGSKFKNIYFSSVEVLDNGSPVMLDKVLESITNVNEFFYSFSIQTPAANASTMKNILKLQNLGDLRYFCLQYVPEVVNVKDLETFITKLKNTKIYLQFSWNISDEYKTQLDGLIDAVIASNVPNRIIIYNGQNEKKLNIMNARYQDDD